MGGPAIIDGKEHDEFDNFYENAPFNLHGYIWRSTEHYFQSAKFVDLSQPNHKEHDSFVMTRIIMKTDRPWLMGQTRDFPIREDWEDIKVNVMYEANRAKFTQNPHLAKRLTDTEGKIIFTGSTPFWNSANAHNLERIRAEFKAQLE